MHVSKGTFHVKSAISREIQVTKGLTLEESGMKPARKVLRGNGCALQKR